MRKIPAFTFYFVYYAATAFLLPFTVLYYRRLEFTGVEMGLLYSITPLITMISAPFWTGIGDATRRHKLIMSLTMTGSILVAACIPFFSSFLVVAGAVFVYAFLISPVAAFADSAAVNMLGDRPDEYGKVRIGGTLGWGLMAPVAGRVIQNNGLNWAFWGFAVVLVIGLAISLLFVYPSAPVGPKKHSSALGGLRFMLRDRRWLLFLGMAFISGMGFSSVNNYLFPYLQELNMSETMMGLALTIATLGELPMFFYSDRLLKRFKSYGLLVLGMFLLGFRLLLYAFLYFPAGVLAFQILGGIAFPAVWSAGVSYAAENAPPGYSASAQGVFGATIFGIGAAVGGLLGSILLASIGGRGLFLVFGVIVLVGLLVFSQLERRFVPPMAADAAVEQA